MPLQQRVIEPVNVSRSTLPLPPGDIKPLIKGLAAATGQGLAAQAAATANINIINELECVSNGTLANLIRQLSSLSRQAEELLTGVFDDASKLLTRTIGLQQRMDVLNAKIEAIDQPSDGPIILRDPTSQQESFSSDMFYDQQILSKQKMPPSIAELYEACDKPPPLNKLDPFRDDGKDGLKFYTDPTYFFELWKKDMMKQQGNIIESRKAAAQVANVNGHLDTIRRDNRHKQQSAQATYGTVQQSLPQQQTIYQQHPHQQQQQYHQQQPQQQNQQQQQPQYQQQLIYQAQNVSQQNQYVGGDQPSSNHKYDQNSSVSDIQSRVSSLSISSTTASVPTQATSTLLRSVPRTTSQTNSDLSHNVVQESPPPPPPPPALSPMPPTALSPPPPPNQPPPPPAPPAPPSTAQQPTVLQPPTAAQLQQRQKELKKTVPVQRDPRSDLLAAIKQGITLRKVEDRKKQVEAEKQSMGNDVASILARRVALQASDSESDQNSDGDDQEWDDAGNQ